MLRYVLIGIIVLSVKCSAQPVADVEVIVTDTYGAPLRAYKVELLRNDRLSVARIDDKSPKRVRIPFGSYTVNGSASLLRIPRDVDQRSELMSITIPK